MLCCDVVDTHGESSRGKWLSELLHNGKGIVLTEELLCALQPLLFSVAHAIYKTSESTSWWCATQCTLKSLFWQIMNIFLAVLIFLQMSTSGIHLDEETAFCMRCSLYLLCNVLSVFNVLTTILFSVK